MNSWFRMTDCVDDSSSKAFLSIRLYIHLYECPSVRDQWYFLWATCFILNSPLLKSARFFFFFWYEAGVHRDSFCSPSHSNPGKFQVSVACFADVFEEPTGLVISFPHQTPNPSRRFSCDYHVTVVRTHARPRVEEVGNLGGRKHEDDELMRLEQQERWWVGHFRGRTKKKKPSYNSDVCMYVHESLKRPDEAVEQE